MKTLGFLWDRAQRCGRWQLASKVPLGVGCNPAKEGGQWL